MAPWPHGPPWPMARAWHVPPVSPAARRPSSAPRRPGAAGLPGRLGAKRQPGILGDGWGWGWGLEGWGILGVRGLGSWKLGGWPVGLMRSHGHAPRGAGTSHQHMIIRSFLKQRMHLVCVAMPKKKQCFSWQLNGSWCCPPVLVRMVLSQDFQWLIRYHMQARGFFKNNWTTLNIKPQQKSTNNF